MGKKKAFSADTFKIAGHDHTYDQGSGVCIWCGTAKEFGGEIACNRKRSKSAAKVIAPSTPPIKTVSKSKPPKVKGSAPKASGSKSVGRCFEKHKPLLIAEGLPPVRGGSCSTPLVDDCDIYIGFERSMKQTFRAFPWKVGYEFCYYIPDMNAPKDPAAFMKMIAWVHEQLKKGQTVHAGCIGGHGRTGTFLAALVFHVTGRKDAIAYVRENYCKKAVESQAQIEFLVKLGMDSAEPTKNYSSTPLGATGMYTGSEKWNKKYKKGGLGAGGMLTLSSDEEAIQPIKCSGSIWGLTTEDE